MSCPYYKTLIFSHRGRCRLAGDRIDNTLGAIERLKKIGIKGVEIDLWLLRDSETVIFHDEFFTLTGRKKETDLATLKEIEASRTSRVLPGQKRGSWARWKKPPTITKIINAFPEFYFNFELKFNHVAGLNEREKLWIKYLVSLVELTSSIERVIFSSFNWDAIDYVTSLSPVIRGGYLFERNIWKEARSRALMKGIFSLHPHYSLVTPTLIIESQEANLKVISWTVNDSEKIKEFILLGIDGIITDYPSLAASIREELCKELEVAKS